MRRTRSIRILVPLVIVLGLAALFAIAGALSGRGASEESGDAGSTTSEYRAAVPEQATRSLDGAADATVTEVAAAVPGSSAVSGRHLVRNGSLSVVVKRGTLLRAVDRVTALTIGMGGYVVSSSVGSDPIAWPTAGEPAAGDGSVAPDGEPTASSGEGYATITVRVPERQFDAALRRYAALGEVEGVATYSEDVTAQYVDLEARLAHHRAVERRLVRFLAATGSVSQMLAVQDRLDKVQLTIEQLTAELKSLREITRYGTITVSLSEKGRAPVATAGTSFWDTFWRSMGLLGRGAEATALALVAVLPFAVVFGCLAALVRVAARRLRRRRPPETPSLSA